jgi:multiple sugar transport system permease protein
LTSYIEIFTERPMLQWLQNSAFVVLIVTIISLCVCTFAGYSLSRYKRRGTIALGWLMLGSRMLPTTLLVIPLFIVMKKLGLLNTLYSVALADLVFIIPFSVWMLKGYFDSIPRDLEEAAWIDGASRVDALIRVIMPLAAPGIAATLLYGAILSWDEFVFARTFINGNQTWTVTLGLAGFKGEYVTYWNDLMAASLIGTIPIMLIFLFMERYLISGLTAGSVKG